MVDAHAHAGVSRHLQIVAEQIFVRRRHDADVARVRERRIEDVELLLAEPVHAQRLLVRAAVQPVVEDSRARAQRRLAVLERRPRDAKARADRVEVVEVRLHFVPDAGAEREPFAHADVVLEVHAGLQVDIVDVRVADPPVVRPRRAGVKGGEALERIRAEIIGRVVRPVRPAVELDARSQRVNAANVVEIRREVERPRVASAGHLRAAARERFDHAHGRRLDDGARRRVGPLERQARVREEPAAQRPGLLNPEKVKVFLVGIGVLG